MMRSKFYVCPVCGNVIHSMGDAQYDAIATNMAEGIKFFAPNFEGEHKQALELIVNNQLANISEIFAAGSAICFDYPASEGSDETSKNEELAGKISYR